MLTAELKAQSGKGSDYFVGNSVTAVDFYWAAFCVVQSLGDGGQGHDRAHGPGLRSGAIDRG